MKVPVNFTGAIFNAKTGLKPEQWHLEADGTIRAPIEVTNELLATCVTDPVAQKVKQSQSIIEASYQDICDKLDYKNPERLLGFIGSPCAQYDADAKAFQRHITDTALAAYRIMGEVLAGKRQEPQSAEELMGLLPIFIQPTVKV
jgi:hypothetical protein